VVIWFMLALAIRNIIVILLKAF